VWAAWWTSGVRKKRDSWRKKRPRQRPGPVPLWKQHHGYLRYGQRGEDEGEDDEDDEDDDEDEHEVNAEEETEKEEHHRDEDDTRQPTQEGQTPDMQPPRRHERLMRIFEKGLFLTGFAMGVGIIGNLMEA